MNGKAYVKKPKNGKALFFKIPSSRNPEITYDLRVMPDGELRCGCMANTMGWQCTHIKFFLKTYNQEREMLMKDIQTEDLVEYKEQIKEVDKLNEKPTPKVKEEIKRKVVPF